MVSRQKPKTRNGSIERRKYDSLHEVVELGDTLEDNTVMSCRVFG